MFGPVWGLQSSKGFCLKPVKLDFEQICYIPGAACAHVSDSCSAETLPVRKEVERH